MKHCNCRPIQANHQNKIKINETWEGHGRPRIKMNQTKSRTSKKHRKTRLFALQYLGTVSRKWDLRPQQFCHPQLVQRRSRFLWRCWCKRFWRWAENCLSYFAALQSCPLYGALLNGQNHGSNMLNCPAGTCNTEETYGSFKQKPSKTICTYTVLKIRKTQLIHTNTCKNMTNTKNTSSMLYFIMILQWASVKTIENSEVHAGFRAFCQQKDQKAKCDGLQVLHSFSCHAHTAHSDVPLCFHPGPYQGPKVPQEETNKSRFTSFQIGHVFVNTWGPALGHWETPKQSTTRTPWYWNHV